MMAFFTIHLYSPANLNLKDLLVANSEHFWLKRIWMLHYINTLIYRGRWHKRSETLNGFVPIKIEYLRNIIGRNYAQPGIQVLRRLKIIEADRRYIVGQKSIGYRFMHPFADVLFKEVLLNDGEAMPRKKAFKCYSKSYVNTQRDYGHRFLFKNLQRVTLDEQIAGKLADIPYENDYQKDYYSRSVEFIQNKDWVFSCHKLTGRVFNNITNCPRLLRPYILLDGKPAVEIDVANCQPLLLLSLYKDEPEVDTFRAAVQGGTFYEMLNEKLEKPYPKERRDDLKTAVFTSIFFGKVYPRPSKMALAFEKLFPILNQKIIAVKTPDHRKLAILLQKTEADLIIGKVVGTIAKISKIPVLTVHDSVITLPEYAADVTKLMANAFYERFGFVPTLKSKNYTEIKGELVIKSTAKQEMALAA